jgi:two-component system KDP operon response regulator KdpE
MQFLNKHIVVIDDTHAILSFLRISLESLGARFSGAATASGGLALCESEKPDLIVLDLGLPDKEGLDILPRLRRLDKERSVPIIVLTVRNQKEDRDMARMLGANAYITKPFIMSELVEEMRVQLKIDVKPHLRLVGTEDEGDYEKEADSIR